MNKCAGLSHVQSAAGTHEHGGRTMVRVTGAPWVPPVQVSTDVIHDVPAAVSSQVQPARGVGIAFQLPPELTAVTSEVL